MVNVEQETANVLAVGVSAWVFSLSGGGHGCGCHWVFSFRGCGGSWVRIAAILFLLEILETGLTYCGIYCTIQEVPEKNGTIERVGGLKDGRNYKMRKMQRLQVVLSGGIEKQPKRLVYP